jgi:hypothetical protein
VSARQEREGTFQLGQPGGLTLSGGIADERLNPVHGLPGRAARVRCDPPAAPDQGETLSQRTSEQRQPFTQQSGINHYNVLLCRCQAESVTYFCRRFAPRAILCQP